MPNTSSALLITVAIVAGAGIGLSLPSKPVPATSADAHFGICHTGGGVNFVVDGDTAWIDGVKVRVADIDAPETHPPRCEREADLGQHATARLAELMNA